MELETWLHSALFLLNVLLWCLRENVSSSPRDHSLEEKPLSATQEEKLRETYSKLSTERLTSRLDEPGLYADARKLISQEIAKRKNRIDSTERLSNFMMFYYQRRRWSKRSGIAKSAKQRQLAEALEYAANCQDLPNMHARNLALYFFARVAALDPSVIPLYEASQRKTSQEGRKFISTVLRLTTDDPTQELDTSLPTELDVFRCPVAGPEDLDYLWVEFYVTGSKQAVRKIVEVLIWPDRVRFKLDRWLRRPAVGFLSKWRRKRVVERLRRVTGIECDLTTNTIKTTEDLDCICSFGLEIRPRTAKEFAKVRAALPFSPSEYDLNYFGTKGAARWSLSSNAYEHPRVLETYQEVRDQQSKDNQLTSLQYALWPLSRC